MLKNVLPAPSEQAQASLGTTDVPAATSPVQEATGAMPRAYEAMTTAAECRSVTLGPRLDYSHTSAPGDLQIVSTVTKVTAPPDLHFDMALLTANLAQLQTGLGALEGPQALSPEQVVAMAAVVRMTKASAETLMTKLEQSGDTLGEMPGVVTTLHRVAEAR